MLVLPSSLSVTVHENKDQYNQRTDCERELCSDHLKKKRNEFQRSRDIGHCFISLLHATMSLNGLRELESQTAKNIPTTSSYHAIRVELPVRK